jgi:predicted dehydrogenase
MLRFENGASGHIFCSTAARPHYRMAVYGTEAFGEVVGFQMDTFRLAPAGGEAVVTETPGFNMLTAELEEFAAAIAGGRAFATPLSQILHGVAVFEAVLRSVASGGVERVAAT